MRRVLPVVQWQLVVARPAVPGLGVHAAAESPTVLEFYSDMHSAGQTPAAAAVVARMPR